jgi:hypothetical protein
MVSTIQGEEEESHQGEGEESHPGECFWERGEVSIRIGAFLFTQSRIGW